MKHLLLTALLSLLLLPALRAQSTSTPSSGFKITGRIKGLKDTTCILAHYFGSTQYIPKDTARLDKDGNFVFEGKSTLPEGMYLTVTPKNGYLELIMTDDQNFAFETDTTGMIKNMKVTGSKENELFYTYQQKLGQFYEESQALNAEKKIRNDAVTAAMVSTKMDDLQKQAQTYRSQFLVDNNNTFAVKLLKATAEPDVPPAPKASNGRPDSIWVFNYYKDHFWDGYDFADERFVRSPVLQRKIDRYLKELTVQTSDSLIREADFMVKKAIAGKSSEVKSFTIWYITSQYERPKVMGTDGLYVHMFEKYYATGIMPVTDTSTISKIAERVKTLKPTLIGKTFVPPIVTDSLRRPIVLQNIKADYTIVYFYAPHCGHCRESAPKIKKFVDDYKGKGAEVVAIAVEDSPEDWKKFIKEFKLGKAINGYDFTSRTDFRHQYDVWTTPTVYVLDKDKKIIARNLPVEQIEDFMLFHKKQQAGNQATKKPVVATANAKAKK